MTTRALPGGYELDDDRARIDRDAVVAALQATYWASDRPREVIEASLDGSLRVVGLYREGEQVGYARAAGDGVIVMYLADVYVLDGHRGRGLGLELVRETVDNGPYAHCRWMLHTRDMHTLYAKLGFIPPDGREMERPLRPTWR